MDYKATTCKRKKRTKIILGVVLILGVAVISSVFAVRHVYQQNLQPLSSSEEIIVVEVPLGATPHEIAVSLEEKGVIKKAWAFEWYVRNSGVRDQLKAGTYALRPSQSVASVVSVVSEGEVATELVTILPGQRVDQVEGSLINAGFGPEEVLSALDPTLYTDHPALVDKPEGASLEGYLYPETFQRTANTTAEEIIRASLDQLQAQLTPDLRAAINKQGLTIHEAIILASVVESEVNTPEDRKQAAQVFLRRIDEGIGLESDVTAKYGSILAGKEPSIFFSSDYNTYENKGLPPGPISNVSASSLTAVAHPSKTNHLFFVAGSDCITRFSATIEEHEQLQVDHGVGCE